MELSMIDLTTKVLAVLLPFVSKGAEEFASKVGEAAFEKARDMFALLKTRWAGDKEATESLTRFTEKPQRYQTVLEDILQEKLVEDKELAGKLSQLLQEMGPALEVVQKMDEGRGVTGLQVGEMKRGSAKVSQDMKSGENIIGIKADNIG